MSATFWPSKKPSNHALIVRNYLLALGDTRCCRCGYAEFKAALQFHHLDLSRKCYTIPHAIARFCNDGFDAYWWTELALEVNKCAILCANCHAAYHAQQWHFDESAQPLHVQVSMPPPDLWAYLQKAQGGSVVG